MSLDARCASSRQATRPRRFSLRPDPDARRRRDHNSHIHIHRGAFGGRGEASITVHRTASVTHTATGCARCSDDDSQPPASITHRAVLSSTINSPSYSSRHAWRLALLLVLVRGDAVVGAWIVIMFILDFVRMFLLKFELILSVGMNFNSV